VARKKIKKSGQEINNQKRESLRNINTKRKETLGKKKIRKSGQEINNQKKGKV